ncbi:hypothetical protein, conserved [Entamoeba histolytica]
MTCITNEWLSQEKNECLLAIKRGDGMESFFHLTNIIQASDTNYSLNYYNTLSSIVFTFISKKNDKTNSNVQLQIKWLRKFFIQEIIKLIEKSSSKNQRSFLLSIKILIILLKNTPTSEDSISLIHLWESIIQCFKVRKNSEFLILVANSLSELYKLSIGIPGIDSVMLNVSFESMITMTSSQERSAAVQFFRVISRYNRKQFTNALTIAMIIIEPIIKNTIIEPIYLKEYMNGVIEILNNIEIYGKEYNFKGIDVDGVILFFIELLKETPKIYTTFNYSLLILIVSFIGFGIAQSKTDSLELLTSYILIEVDDRNKQIDNYLENIVQNIIKRFSFSSSNQITINALIKLISSLIKTRCNIYIHLVNNNIMEEFNSYIYLNISSDIRKPEELHFLSCLICAGHTEKEKLWFENELKKWGGIEFLVSLFIIESQHNKNSQNAFISLGESINYLIESNLNNILLLKKVIYSFLSFPMTLNSRIKCSYLKECTKIKWKQCISFDNCHRILPTLSLRLMLERVISSFIVDPDEVVRKIAYETFTEVSVTILNTSLNEFLLKLFSQTIVQIHPLFRLTSIQTFAILLKKITHTPVIPFVLSRLPNPLENISERLLRITLDDGLNLLNTSLSMYGKIGNLSIVNGLIAFCEIVQCVTRSQQKVISSSRIKCYLFVKNLLRCIVEVLGIQMNSTQLAVQKKHLEEIKSPLLNSLINYLVSIELRSGNLESPIIILTQKIILSLASIVRSIGLNGWEVIELCNYLRVLHDVCPLEIILLLREILQSQLTIYSVNFNLFQSISSLFMQWDYWILPETKIEFIGERRAWAEINDTSMLLIEELVNNESIDYNLRCSILNYGYLFVRIGNSIGAPVIGESIRLTLTTGNTDYEILYQNLQKQLQFDNSHLDNISTLFPNIYVPSFVIFPPLNQSLNYTILIEELTTLKFIIINKPLNPQFHLQTLLQITHYCIILHSIILNKSTSKMISKLSQIINDKLIQKILSSNQNILIGAQMGYRQIVTLIESDKSIIHKNSFIKEIQNHVDLLTAFHMAFELLMSVLKDSFIHGIYSDETIKLFIDCVLPMYWSIRSSRNTHLFFLKPLIPIQLTEIFIQQASTIVQFPRTYRTIAFSKLFENVYLCSSGVVNHLEVFNRIKDNKKYLFLINLMKEANWSKDIQPKHNEIVCKKINDIDKLINNIQLGSKELFIFLINLKIPLSMKVYEKLAFFASRPKIYSSIKDSFPNFPQRDYHLLFDYFTSFSQSIGNKYNDLDDSSFSLSNFISNYSQLISDIPFLRDTAFISCASIASIQEIAEDKKEESTEKRIEEDEIQIKKQILLKERKDENNNIERLFTLLYSRIDTRYYSLTKKLKIPYIVLFHLKQKLTSLLLHYIYLLPIYKNNTLISVLNEKQLLMTTFWQYRTPPVNSIHEVLTSLNTLARQLPIPSSDLNKICDDLLTGFLSNKQPFYLIIILSLLSHYDNVISIGIEQPRRVLTWGQLPITSHWGTINESLIKRVQSSFFQIDSFGNVSFNQLILPVLQSDEKIREFIKFLIFFQPYFNIKQQKLLISFYATMQKQQSSIQILITYAFFSLLLLHPDWNRSLFKIDTEIQCIGIILALNHNIPSLLENYSLLSPIVSSCLEFIFNCHIEDVILTIDVINPPFKMSWRIAATFLVSLFDAITEDDICVLIAIFGKNIFPKDLISQRIFIVKTKQTIFEKLTFIPSFNG